MTRPHPRQADALALASGIAIVSVALIAVADIVAHGSLEPAVMTLVASTIAPLTPALIIRYGINPNRSGHEQSPPQ
jgi:hypothetical protein